MPIHIKGASEHNLRNVDAEFGDGLTVVTGVSGSGKTSLVFDTLYHEARRRFLEIFSLGSSGLRLAPARVESITGLGPAIAVGQNLLNRNPTSTLATASGLHPFLRLLYANFGVRYCANCGAALSLWTEDEVVEQLVTMSSQGVLDVFVPLVREALGSHATLIDLLVREFGTAALRVDGQSWQGGRLDPSKPHSIEIQLGRLTGRTTAKRARELVSAAKALGAPALIAQSEASSRMLSRTLSYAPVCIQCGTWISDMSATHFHLPCPHCEGHGCEHCDGTGLHPEAAAVRWNGLRLPDLLARSVGDVRALLAQTGLPISAQRLRVEIERRLEALDRVGLGYIALDRSAPTFSRGEAQRVRIAVALTSRLEDMLHVLDEPTIGLHPADVATLLPALRDLAGPVVYVEHDRVAAAVADHALDIGPGAGHEGGQVVYAGTPAGLWQADTPTGRYFSLRERVPAPPLRPAPKRFLTVRGADLRNLRDIDVPIPLGRFTVITGVSGSGKSTFVEGVLVASLEVGKPIGCADIEGPMIKPVLVDQDPIGLNPRSNPATYTKLADIIRDCYATATGLSPSHFSFNRPEGACPSCNGMGAVEVRMRYLPSTWIPCADCEGQRFSEEVLAARVTFGERALSIADIYESRIAAVVPLLLEPDRLPEKSRQAAERILRALCDVGLGYLSLGQPSPTLSGGEAQRVKLAKYLGARSLSQQLLVLDEPSTGLHPQDVAGLLAVLDRLVRGGATVVVVEHNTDIIRAADWVVDLGPGAGAAGGDLVYAGPAEGLSDVPESLTGQALRDETTVRPHSRAKGAAPAHKRSAAIAIRGARAHNLKDVSVDFPKGALTVVTGVSGSGKSSLVDGVLEAEARRRFLETLSMYERQSTREGPEAPVESVSGLGVAITIDSSRHRFERRATVGGASELSHHLAILLSTVGERHCLHCGASMSRDAGSAYGPRWRCPDCSATAPVAEPRYFSPSTYGAACVKCHGVGTLQVPNPNKLIIHPEMPLCDAMYSPGFFPKGYLCKPFNGGYDMVQALAARYGFDPAVTPWNHLSPEAQQAFLFGDPVPMPVTYRSRTGRVRTHTQTFPGFYGWVRDWDTGGTYTDTAICPECQGARLRPEYLAVTLHSHNMHALSEMPLRDLARVMKNPLAFETNDGDASSSVAGSALRTIRVRLRFLQQVGLGYLHLNRLSATLSAGEAQRVRLAGLLGSGLTALTVLLDEPSRGLHPVEVEALLEALRALRDGLSVGTDVPVVRNTVIVVEHDPVIMRAADYLVDMGPGAGTAGGEIVAQGKPNDVMKTTTLTAAWLRGERHVDLAGPRRQPLSWLTVRGARANNLCGEVVQLPLGMLVGVCGVSGSGKSTLVIDTLGRALAPKKHTTSVAQEPIDPGEHDAIEGAPVRVMIVDQSKAGVVSPAAFLGLDQPLRALYAASADAHALGLGEDQLARRCSVCNGSGAIKTDMGFLPDVYTPCEACRGSGYVPEAWEVRLHGLALPEVFGLTIDQVYELFGDQPALARPLSAAREVGLGYLVLRQPGYALSGGEAQRLKIALELMGTGTPPNLPLPRGGEHPSPLLTKEGPGEVGSTPPDHTLPRGGEHPSPLLTKEGLGEVASAPRGAKGQRRGATDQTLFILDEPTVGQHLEDVARLVGVLHRLVDAGHSVFVVEHHTHLLAACDWLLELGPGGGPEGGRVVAAGTPEQVAAGDTLTAPFLRDVLEASR